MLVNNLQLKRGNEGSKVAKAVSIALATALVAMLVALLLPQPAYADPDPGWYSTDWSYRKKITFTSDSNKIPSAQSYFPVLISLSSDSDLATHAQDDGDDILFTSSDGTTQLDHEIEKFDGGTGELVAWVEVPSLSTGTVIYMYYGNSGASNQENATGTWDANYEFVWHLHETGTTIYDSADSFDATGTGINDFSSAQIDGGKDIPGGSDGIRSNSSLSIGTGNFTFEIWASMDRHDSGSDWSIFGLEEQNNYCNGWWIFKGEWCYWSDKGSEFSTGVDATVDIWFYVVLTRSGTDVHAYVDGEDKASDTDCKNYGDDKDVLVGTCAAEPLDGKVDEVRISNIARSANWIKTCYNNQSDPSSFYSVGSKEYLHHLVITGSTTQFAGASQDITITAKTNLGNTYTAYTGDKSLTFSGASDAPDGTHPTVTDKNGSAVNFGATTTITFSNGTATRSMTLYKAEPAEIEVTDSDGYTTTASADYDLNVTVSPGAANNLNFDQQPSNTVAGATITPAVTVEVRDQWNNVRTSDNTTSVAIAINNNPGGGILSGTIPRTASSGIATFNDLSIDKTGNGYTLDATSTGLTTATSSGFNITAGAASYLKVTGSANMTAGGTNELTITAYDANHNAATGYTGSKNLTFSGPGNAPDGTVPTVEGTNIGTATPVNFTNGVSDTGTATLIAYKAETTAVDVTDGTINSSADPSYDLDLTVNPGALDHFTMTGYPASITAGQNFGANDVVITAYGAYNNTNTNYTGQVYFTSSDPQATLPYTEASKYTFTTGAGGDNGVHTFAGTGFTLKTAGPQTITLTGSPSVTSSPITVNPATSHTVTLTAAPINVPADGSSTSTLTATVKDQYGNNVADGTNVTFTAEYGTFASSTVTKQTLGGEATATLTSESSTETVIATVTATANGVSDATAVFFVPEGGAEVEESKTETVTGSGTVLNTPTGGDVSIDATGCQTITVAKYEDIPCGTPTFQVTGDYWDVHLDNVTGVNSLTIEFCPADEDTAIYYWDGSSWRRASDQRYSNGCIVVTITDSTSPGLSALSGLPLASGTPYPPTPVGGEVYPVNKLAILMPWIALFAAIVVAAETILRRRRAQG